MEPWERGRDLHPQPPGYEPGALLLCHPAVIFLKPAGNHPSPLNTLINGRADIFTAAGTNSSEEIIALGRQLALLRPRRTDVSLIVPPCRRGRVGMNYLRTVI